MIQDQDKCPNCNSAKTSIRISGEIENGETKNDVLVFRCDACGYVEEELLDD